MSGERVAGRPHAWLWEALLAAAVCVFVVATALSVRSFADFTSTNRDALRWAGWITAQAQQEYHRLLEALARYRANDPEIDRDAVALRLDLFWSRLDVVRSSEESVLLRAIPDVMPATDTIMERLAALDPQIRALARDDARGYAEIRGAMAAFREPLRLMVQRVTHDEVIVAEQSRVSPAEIMLMLGGVAASGALLILLLVRELRRSRRLRRLAEAERSSALLARTQLSDAIEAIPGGFALFDARDRLVLCNARYRDTLGADIVALGRTGAEIVEALVARGRCVIGEVDRALWIAGHLERRRQFDYAFELLLSSGDYLRFARRRSSDGGVVTVFVDISDLHTRERELREAREHAEASSMAKSRFLANMSHELRTPLNAVIGMSEAIATEVLGPIAHAKYREYAHDIHFSGRHLLGIVSEILDMARIEAGSVSLERSTFDVARLLDAIARMMSERAAAAGIALDIAAAPGLPMLNADERLLRQSLLNLVGNAVKFTPAGGTVRLEAQRTADGGLRFIVADSGIGIAADDLPRIITPFGRSSDPKVASKEGIGLGLPLTKLMIESHGGRLEIASVPDQGTTVVVTLGASCIEDAVAAAE